MPNLLRPSELERGDRIKLAGGVIGTVQAKPQRDGQWGYRVITDRAEFWSDYADEHELVGASRSSHKEPSDA